MLILVFIALEAAYLLYKKHFLKGATAGNMPNMLVTLEPPSQLAPTPPAAAEKEATEKELKQQPVTSGESTVTIEA